MEENFNLLFSRILDTLNKTDLLKVKEQLSSIRGNTIFVGVGGSSVVSDFASKVELNNGINTCMGPRDLLYKNINNYDNIIIFSYSGKGYVVDSIKDINKNIYLFTNNDIKYDNITTIKYDNFINKEKSFISLAATLMPIVIYYGANRIHDYNAYLEELKMMFNQDKLFIGNKDTYEIIGGCEYSSSIKYLESTLVESSIAKPIIHDTYNYCHGRSTTSYHNDNGLIIFDSEHELDKLLIEEAPKYYSDIVKINKLFKGDYRKSYLLLNEIAALIQSMYLTKSLAKNTDLSKIDYNPIVKKLYYFNGSM